MVRSPHLNPAMQAVDIYVDIDGQRVRAVIPREVLEGHFQAEGTPESWLQTAESRTTALTAVIRRRVRARPGDLVVVRSADFT